MVLLAALSLGLSCGDEPPPSLDAGRDAGTVDMGMISLDAGFLPDASEADATAADALTQDAEAADATSADAAVADAADADATAADATIADATPGDAGPDAGFGIPDSDGDGISDQDEGNGLVDTDNDMIPDSLDDDSDNDGIPDSVEAGDGDPLTPPIDTDNDMIPDFRDDDSDGDTLLDSVELLADPDGDQVPAFRDDDSDGDGLLDSVELDGDPDNDQIGNWLDEDDDGDTIRTRDEGASDPDADQIPAYLDLDSDGDGISDAMEAGDTILASPPRDSDFDQTPDFLDLDSDDDAIPDSLEGIADTDGDTIPDRIDIDSDGDSLLDMDEAGDNDLMTPPYDSDMDGTYDFRDTDSDNDFIADVYERIADTDGDQILDRFDTDSDNDGVPDSVEAGDMNLATPPVDTDNDSVPDFRDLDSDDDGLADSAEPGCPAGPSRLSADSDNDTFVDLAEVAYGSNPCSAASGINDFYFVMPPLDPPQNAPLVFNDTGIDRADLAINIDNTGSMGEEIANLQASLSNTIIPGVGAVIPSPAFAVSSFEDYPVEPFGRGADGDLPFRLNTRVTTDGVAAQAAVNSLTIKNGRDLPESGIEALYQVAAGAGTQWSTGSVPAFNPSQNRITGVADGDIGGVGFRADSLPVVVHVTDASSHTRGEYTLVDPQISAVDTAVASAALSGIGARVISIANQYLPRPPSFDDLCSRVDALFYGSIATPVGTDVDWFRLTGAASGQTVRAEVIASRYGSDLDSMLAVFDSTGALLAGNDDLQAGNTLDSLVSVTLSGTAPFYVAVTAYNDPEFDGTGGASTGFYFLDVRVNGTGYTTSPVGCRGTDDGNSAAAARSLVTLQTAAAPANVGQCVAACEAMQSPALEPFRLPYGMSELTNATIPPCAWNEFGTSWPNGCGQNQCCTGLNGAGVATNAAGQCPLSFQIDSNGTGLGNAVVAGIEALVNFSAFTITTVTRPDPAELMASGIDTTCFVHGVIPTSATPPNACAPTPTPVDLVPPTPELDSFENVVPGTVLTFQVNAENRQGTSMAPCADRQASPRLFRAYIDVVADGVTVVDTRDVIIIVPPLPPSNGG